MTNEMPNELSKRRIVACVIIVPRRGQTATLKRCLTLKM